jgi:hypothetical protein
MQKLNRMVIAGAIAALSVHAQAATIAGWDFSQWVGDSLLSTDGATATNVLSANYSTLDPTNNAGAESAAFGTLYFNGQFGSTNVPAIGDGSEPFIPVAGSLVSNINGPVEGLGDNPFDSHTILTSEGQPYTQFLSMGATSPLQVVFAADLTGVPESASNWLVTFGARTNGPSALGIEFSTNGIDYVSAGSVNLTGADTPYSVNLSALEADRAFVRFSFAGVLDGAQFIDNVAIQGTVVPEPVTGVLVLASALILVALRRRTA